MPKQLLNNIINPIALLKWSKLIATAIIFIAAGLSILIFTSIGILNYWVAPKVAYWRADIERLASEYIGTQVSIEQISADTSYLIPSFLLDGVRFKSTQSSGTDEVLEIPKVSIDLSVASIMRLSFDHVLIENPNVSVQKDNEGNIHVAGLPITSSDSNKGTDWFFSQPNLQVHRATVILSDENKSNKPIKFNEVEIVFLNGLKSHAMKIEATPPTEFGQRFSLQGEFKESLLSTHAGEFKNWSGNIQVTLPEIELSLLNRYFPQNNSFSIDSAKGWVRIWSKIKKGEVNQFTTDISFSEIKANTNLIKNINLKNIGGRLIANLDSKKQEIKAKDFKFTTQDGALWDLNNAFFEWHPKIIEPENLTKSDITNAIVDVENQNILSTLFKPGTGSIGIDKVSLQPIKNQLNNFLFDSKIIQNLKRIDMGGNLTKFKFSWDFDGRSTKNYKTDGVLDNFKFDRGLNQETDFLKGFPGVENANIHFKVANEGGSATIDIKNGFISLPRWLDDPIVQLKQANAELIWHQTENQFDLQIINATVLNEDAQGGFNLNWSSDSRNGSDNKDNIDLKIDIRDGKAKQIYRYLPNKIEPWLRKYLQEAITQGSINGGSIKIKGPLDKFPFANAKEGEFHIVAHAQDLNYQYYPQGSNELKGQSQLKTWPELLHLNADLVIDRKSLSIKNAAAKLATSQANNIDIYDINTEIVDFFKPVLSVKAKAKGSLSDALKVVNSSAIGELLGDSLSSSQSSGGSLSEFNLNLNLPLNDLSKTKVQGGVTFVNNDLFLSPNLPTLNKVRGSLSFNEAGFTLSNLRARILGSEAKLEGGLKFVSDKTDFNSDNSIIKIQGQISSDGLKQAKENPIISKLAKFLNGQTSYFATAVVRKGQLDFELNSSLFGLGSDLPAPLGKTMDSQLPLKLNVTLQPEATPVPLNKTSAAASLSQTGQNNSAYPSMPRKALKTTLSVGQALFMSFLSEAASTVSQSNNKNSKLNANPPTFFERGWIGIYSGVRPQIPTVLESGIFVNVDVPRLDADSWESVISNFDETTDLSRDVSKEGNKNIKRDSAANQNLNLNVPLQTQGKLIPTGIRVKAAEMVLSRRSIHQVSLDASYQDASPSGLWHLNINSTEAKGAIDYKISSQSLAAKIYARMTLLNIPPAAVDSVESLLNEKDSLLPTLDIVVDELEIKGKKLGRAEIEATNQLQSDGGKEWRINKLNLTVPEAKFQATGVWALIKESEKSQNIKKTTLNFNLDIENAGQLLDRLGTKGAVNAGKGKLAGQVAWNGSPLQMDYPSLNGHFNVNVEKGSFLKTEPGAARLLGVLNLQALPRRLFLDFKDIFSDGFSFDFFRGDIGIDLGIAKTNNLQMKGVNAAILMEGFADISRETQHLKVIVIPEIDAGTASLVVAAINPIVGISSYLAQYFLKKPISQAATKDFIIDGTWSDPTVTKVDSRGEIKK